MVDVGIYPNSVFKLTYQTDSDRYSIIVQRNPYAELETLTSDKTGRPANSTVIPGNNINNTTKGNITIITNNTKNASTTTPTTPNKTTTTPNTTIPIANKTVNITMNPPVMPPITGGFSDVSQTNENYLISLKYAIDQYSLLKNLKVVKAEQQVVAGYNFRITF